MSPSLRKLARGTLLRMVHRIAPTEAETAVRFLEARGFAAFPKRNVTVAKEVPVGRVLILSPHPDDEAIGMGGTLAMHVANGSEVTVLYMTDGGGLDEPREAMIRTRRAEAEALGASLGVRQIFWDNVDTRLTNDGPTVQALVDALAELRPEHVYTPSMFDHHYDHFATNQVLVDALERLPDCRPQVAGYEVWDNVPFANYVVDISSHAAAKEAALAHYATPLSYTDFPRLCRYRNSVHYTLHVDSRLEHAGVGFAEAFLRYDAELYGDLFRAWVRTLNRDGNLQTSHLQPGGRVSDIQRVFIIGLPRSGTTWMMWLLAQHPEVVALQQSGMFLPVKRLEEWWCHDHRFSKGRGAEASSGSRYTMAGTTSVINPMEFYEQARAMLNVVLERVLAATPGARVIVDQTPEHIEFVPLIRSIFPDAWFLHVIRDPRAVYSSMHKAVSSWADPSGFPDTPVHIARGWTRFIQLGRQIGVTTERYHEVHYEELKVDPEKGLRAIHEWLGLESTSDSRAKAIESCGIDKLRKHTTMPQGFFRRGTSEGWKEDIRGSHLRVIEYLARAEMERHGYECVHPRSHKKPLRLSTYELLQNLINAPARRRVMRRPQHAFSKLGRTLQLMRDFKLVQY